MKEILLAKISCSITTEGKNIRVKSNDYDIILINQTVEDVIKIVTNNFNVVNNYFIANVVNQSSEIFDISDITRISASIMLHYLYMYNSWNNTYLKRKDQELLFRKEDFTNPVTYDIIINFFKIRYPHEWKHKVTILIGMPLEDFNRFSSEREKFYNK